MAAVETTSTSLTVTAANRYDGGEAMEGSATQLDDDFDETCLSSTGDVGGVVGEKSHEKGVGGGEIGKGLVVVKGGESSPAPKPSFPISSPPGAKSEAEFVPFTAQVTTPVIKVKKTNKRRGAIKVGRSKKR